MKYRAEYITGGSGSPATSEVHYATLDELVQELGSTYEPGFRLLTVEEDGRQVGEDRLSAIVLDMALVFLKHSVASQLKMPYSKAGEFVESVMRARYSGLQRPSEDNCHQL
jgi:hypothetical protein